MSRRTCASSLEFASRTVMVSLIASLFLAACGHGSRVSVSEQVPSAEEPTIAVLVETLTPQERRQIATQVQGAIRLVREFAQQHHWASEFQQVDVRRIEVLSTQDRVWRRVLDLAGLSAETPIPTDGLAAGCESGVCVIVQPSEYMRIRPEYAHEPDAWMGLVAHELAHRLHVRILAGDEDAMGPRWFFEGFAIVVAGQRLPFGGNFESASEAVDAASAAGGRGSYATYGAVVRYLMTEISLNDLVQRARVPEFETWARGL